MDELDGFQRLGIIEIRFLPIGGKGRGAVGVESRLQPEIKKWQTESKASVSGIAFG
jgi:hypothetical protein